jgi:hypothetical protein
MIAATSPSSPPPVIIVTDAEKQTYTPRQRPATPKTPTHSTQPQPRHYYSPGSPSMGFTIGKGGTFSMR